MHQNLLLRSLLFSAAFLAFGCDNEVMVEPQGSSTGSASSSTGSSGNGGEGGASVSSSSGAGGSGGMGGSGGGASLCAELEPLKLEPGLLMDVDQNGKWSPGESAIVNVNMTNTSNVDINYPGIQMQSDNPLVTTGNPYNALFVIFANQTTELGVTFAADSMIAPGTNVKFSVTLHNIMNESCINLPKLEMTVPIE
jgi:hypothetical protein